MAIREVIFRGKRTDNGKWECGDLLSPNEFNAIPHIVYIDYLNEYGDIGEISTPVIPETVGQFTGLTDKNGKRIFEGDIVKCTDTINDFEFNAVVEFGNPNGEYNWGYQLKFISGEESNFDILCWVDMEETGAYIEVIGNIHDNPELLEGGEGNG